MQQLQIRSRECTPCELFVAYPPTHPPTYHQMTNDELQQVLQHAVAHGPWGQAVQMQEPCQAAAECQCPGACKAGGCVLRVLAAKKHRQMGLKQACTTES